jgi:hypothetical protein
MGLHMFFHMVNKEDTWLMWAMIVDKCMIISLPFISILNSDPMTKISCHTTFLFVDQLRVKDFSQWNQVRLTFRNKEGSSS